MKNFNLPKLVAAILICEAAGIIGSVFTVSSIPTWYATLAKPSFTPPNWIFGPVWITLYFLMGVALYLVWLKGLKSKKTRQALLIFAMQLFLNAAWSIVFFGRHSPFGGLVIIILLWVLILMSLLRFWGIDKPAGLLLMPYLVWVSLALVLNFFVWKLN